MATLTQTFVQPLGASASASSSSCASSSSSSSGFLLQSAAPASFDPEQGCFALARVFDNVCLVQTDKRMSSHSPGGTSQQQQQPSAPPPMFLAPVDVAVFRHEFGTMFRYAHRATVRAADIRILAPIAQEQVLCEDSGVVFVDRALTNQLLRWTAPRRTTASPHTTTTTSPHTTRRRY